MDMTPNSAAENRWSVALHLSQYLGYMLPVVGFILPLTIWLMKKNQSTTINQHGKAVFNWVISASILFGLCMLLSRVGLGFLGFAILMVLCLIFPLIGAIKATDGRVWRYPLSYTFLR